VSGHRAGEQCEMCGFVLTADCGSAVIESTDGLMRVVLCWPCGQAWMGRDRLRDAGLAVAGRREQVPHRGHQRAKRNGRSRRRGRRN
jgi:hypothetical protein